QAIPFPARELFLDNALIDSVSENLERRIVQPSKHPVPVLTRVQDWERARVQEPEVIYDEERKMFRMWYVAYPELQAGEARRNIGRIAYAESEDGVSWYRPEF